MLKTRVRYAIYGHKQQLYPSRPVMARVTYIFFCLILLIFDCTGLSLLRSLFSSFGKWGLLSGRDVSASHCIAVSLVAGHRP